MTITVSQARDGGGLDQDGSNEGGEKQPHSRRILKYSQQDLLMDWGERKKGMWTTPRV